MAVALRGGSLAPAFLEVWLLRGVLWHRLLGSLARSLTTLGGVEGDGHGEPSLPPLFVIPSPRVARPLCCATLVGTHYCDFRSLVAQPRWETRFWCFSVTCCKTLMGTYVCDFRSIVSTYRSLNPPWLLYVVVDLLICGETLAAGFFKLRAATSSSIVSCVAFV